MKTKEARIEAVMARKALSAEEKNRKIAAILAEEESNEEDETTAEDEDDTEDTTAEDGGGEGGDDDDETTAEDGDDETDPEAEDEDEEQTATKAAAKLAGARKIAKSAEAKANPMFALNAIANGVSFAAFKAMAPAAGKGGLASRMDNEPGARRLGGDAPQANRGRKGKVVALRPASDYYAAAEGKKKSG